MRACLIDGQAVKALLPTVGVLIGAGLVVIAVGLVIFRHVEAYAKKAGRLKRSG
jgi:hypothetical protein